MKYILLLISLISSSFFVNAQSAQLNGAPLNSNFNYNNTSPTILQGPGVEADVTIQLVTVAATMPPDRLKVIFEFSNYQYWDVLNVGTIVPPPNFVVFSDYVDVNSRVIVFTNAAAITNFTGNFNFTIRGIAKTANPSFTGNSARLEENVFASGQFNFVLSNGSISNVLSIGTEPLPIEMGPLTATKFEANKAQLDWHTYKEEGIHEFVIERSIDGQKWITMGKVPSISKGNLHQLQQNYQYFDAQPKAGINLYRIKIQDVNNEVHYTNIASLHFEENKYTVSAYPNPATDWLYLNAPINATITIYNSQGIVQKCKVEHNNDRYSINLAAFPAGVYSAHIQSESISQYISFVKIN